MTSGKEAGCWQRTKLTAVMVSIKISIFMGDLEYGTDALEMHIDAVEPGERVLIVDDVIATGGTAFAAVELLRRAQAEVVGVVVFIELGFLNGKATLEGVPFHALVRFD